MADLKILRRDGYQELSGIQDAIRNGSLKIRDLWQAVGQGDTDRGALILFEAGFGKEDDLSENIRDIVVVSVPDDIHGEFYRIWVKRKK